PRQSRDHAANVADAGRTAADHRARALRVRQAATPPGARQVLTGEETASVWLPSLGELSRRRVVAAGKDDDHRTQTRRLLVASPPRLNILLAHDLSDLPSPAEASSETTTGAMGFAQAGNRCPLFGIMRCQPSARSAAAPTSGRSAASMKDLPIASAASGES